MAEIVFLHQENLNSELYEFLLYVGYPKNKITFIKNANRVNITPRERDEQDLASFYTRELLQDVLRRDKLIFEIFSEYEREAMEVKNCISKLSIRSRGRKEKS